MGWEVHFSTLELIQAVLILVQYLSTMSSFVCAFRLKSDEKYGTVLPRLADLLNIVSEQPYHVQAQESIVVCVCVY